MNIGRINAVSGFWIINLNKIIFCNSQILNCDQPRADFYLTEVTFSDVSASCLFTVKLPWKNVRLVINDIIVGFLRRYEREKSTPPPLFL